MTKTLEVSKRLLELAEYHGIQARVCSTIAAENQILKAYDHEKTYAERAVKHLEYVDLLRSIIIPPPGEKDDN